MRRRAKHPGIPTKMYRHFAVATVVMTSFLAIMADDNNRQAAADELSSRAQAAELATASEAKFGKPKLIAKNPKPAHWSNGDMYDGSDFGAPMDTGGVTRLGPDYAPGVSSSRVGLGIDYTALGMTKEEFDKLDPREQQELLAKLRATRERQSKSLIESSLSRSGGEGAVDF